MIVRKEMLLSLAYWAFVHMMITGMVVMMDYQYFKKVRSLLRKGNTNHTTDASNTTKEKQGKIMSLKDARAEGRVSLWLKKRLKSFRKIQPKDYENTLLASYHVLDAWAGRLQNGLAENSRKSFVVFTAFNIHTSSLWEHAIFCAVLCNCFLVFYRSCFHQKFLSGLCILFIALDIILKVAYMGVRKYFEKNWHISYAVVASVLLSDFLFSIIAQEHKHSLIFCFRPVLLCLRERSIRNFFAIVKNMGPGFGKVCFPLLFFLAFVSSFTSSWFHQDFPEFFGSTSSTLFNYWLLISTGDKFADLLAPSLSTSPIYLSTFFVVLIVGNFLLLSMLRAVTYDVFLEHTKYKARKERFKELKGLLKAFSVLDKSQSGTISRSAFESLVSYLKPGANASQLMLYSELAMNGEKEITVINFLNLKNIMSYDFIDKNDTSHKPRRQRFFQKRPGFRSTVHEKRKYEKFLDSFFTTIFSKPWQSKLMVIVAALDIAILFVEDPPAGQILAVILYFVGLLDLLIRHFIHGSLSKHGKFALFAFAISPLLEILCIQRFAVVLKMAAQRRHFFLKVKQTVRLVRCWHLVELSKNLQKYVSSFYLVLPPFFATVTFAMIVTYFFAMLGMELFDNQVKYFTSPAVAVLTMTQILFEVDFLSVIEECSSSEESLGIAVIFFLSYYVVGVLIAFNLINAIIVQFYSEMMKVCSRTLEEESKNSDLNLEKVITENITENIVTGQMQFHSDTPMPTFQPHRTKNNVSRKSLGSLTSQIAKAEVSSKVVSEDLKQLQKYANTIQYSVNLLSMYHGESQVASEEQDFEKEFYYDLLSNKIDKKISTKTYQQGDLIISMGNIMRHCFFVHNGIVDVTFQNHPVTNLKKGQIFGHESMLSGLPCMLDYTARDEKVQVIFVDKNTFFNVFDYDMQGKFAQMVVRSAILQESSTTQISKIQFRDDFLMKPTNREFQTHYSYCLKNDPNKCQMNESVLHICPRREINQQDHYPSFAELSELNEAKVILDVVEFDPICWFLNRENNPSVQCAKRMATGKNTKLEPSSDHLSPTEENKLIALKEKSNCLVC